LPPLRRQPWRLPRLQQVLLAQTNPAMAGARVAAAAAVAAVAVATKMA
jgi:hypothetical protein